MYLTEQMNLVIRAMAWPRSMEYTSKALKDLQVELEERLEGIEMMVKQRDLMKIKEWVIRAIMARLGLADPSVGSLVV
ncbi:hypothetical protein TWF694_000304 [Orbilia ellipsospora]|uniref:Uncharacterized protein n=1 Tax=Orbilia ellipsospora TaxID=2528407 RepID=A0AAV9XN72_9PEZI